MKRFWSLVLTVSLILVFASIGYAFSDTDAHWAKSYITRLAELKAIKGYSNGSFKPNGNISRAEFTAALLRAVGEDPGQPGTGDWYDNYMKAAREKGYIKEGEFDDAALLISRMEIARMIVRALGKEEAAAKLVDVLTKFRDDDTISGANKGYVRVCYEYGVISGTPDGRFLPNAYATRAEAAKMIVTFLDNRGKDIEIDAGKPANDALMMYEYEEKKEVAVTTSHPELIPHIRKGLEILSQEGYLVYYYVKESDKIEFNLYRNKEEAEKPIWEQNWFLSYYILLEKDSRSKDYLPYKIHLYDTQNVIGQKKLKEIIHDVFPEAYNKTIKELENKIKDTNYQNTVWEKVNGREIRIFSSSGYNQIDVYIALEN